MRLKQNSKKISEQCPAQAKLPGLEESVQLQSPFRLTRPDPFNPLNNIAHPRLNQNQNTSNNAQNQVTPSTSTSRPTSDSKCEASSNNTSNLFPAMDLKLEKITIPTFDGDLTQWISFRDQFVDLVHTNPRLTPIVKFTMLRNHLKGLAAAGAINGFKLSNADYETAWHIIMNRYNRPDKIIDEYLRRFYELPRLHSPTTAAQLIKMANSANQLVRVLPNLGQNVDTWDTWILFDLRERLDPVTLMKWTDIVKGRQNTKLSEFFDFLELEATEAIPIESKTKRHQKPSIHLATEPTTMHLVDQIKCAHCRDFTEK